MPFDEGAIERAKEQRLRVFEAMEVLQRAVEEDPDRDDLTPEEAKELSQFQAEYQQLTYRIEVLEKQAAVAMIHSEGSGRVTDPDDVVEATKPQTASNVNARREEAPATNEIQAAALGLGRYRQVLKSKTFGFESIGHWASAVAAAGTGGRVDDKLRIVRAESQERYGETGGFLVPTEMSQMIMQVVLGDSVASLAGRCYQMPVSGNTMDVPLNMDVPYGNSGIQAYWGGESGRHRESQPEFESNRITVEKVTAFVKVTEELLEDGPAIGSFINQYAPRRIAWEIGNAIVNGDGVKKPKGLLNSDALVTVAAEPSQTADTFTDDNAYAMYTALPADSQMNAIWLCSPSAQAQVMKLTQVNRGDPGRGIDQRPYNMLLERPVMQHLACQALGNPGDVILADFSKYLFVYKTSGVTNAMSMHMDFDKDLVAMKFQMRCNGQVAWSDKIGIPNDSSHMLSPFAVVASR